MKKGNALIKSYLSDKLIKKLNFENSNHQSISLFRLITKVYKFLERRCYPSTLDKFEMLSISDIEKLKNLLFGQFMIWPFCGAEHLSKDDRWQTGYEKISKLF